MDRAPGGPDAPGLTDLTAAVRASYHLHLGHGLAVQAIRAASSDARVGIVNNLSPIEPASTSEADLAAARRADGHINRWWLDPVLGRGYPQDMVELYGVELPVQPGDLETIAAPLDAWACYYFRQIVTADPSGRAPGFTQVPVADARHTHMDWEVYADGLEQLLLRLTEEYGVERIYVTENGSAFQDTVAADGSVHDPERVRYLEEHLAACARAVAKGAPLAGYFAWSLLDNFEWAYGYDKRFGLVHVDYATQRSNWSRPAAAGTRSWSGSTRGGGRGRSPEYLFLPRACRHTVGVARKAPGRGGSPPRPGAFSRGGDDRLRGGGLERHEAEGSLGRGPGTKGKAVAATDFRGRHGLSHRTGSGQRTVRQVSPPGRVSRGRRRTRRASCPTGCRAPWCSPGRSGRLPATPMSSMPPLPAVSVWTVVQSWPFVEVWTV
ncbi:6-phospho-beta-galactosidase [Streptomyces microflavus]